MVLVLEVPCEYTLTICTSCAPVQKRLPARWRALVTRDSSGMLSKKGQVWACPYRWGCTLIAYRKGALLRCVLSLNVCILG